MGTRRVATLLVLAGFLAGIALDRLWLEAHAPIFSNAILLRPGVTMFGAKVLAGFAFGVLTPLLLALVVLAIALFPWTHASYPVARKERFRLMARMTLLILLLPAWVLAFGFAYKLAKSYLPAPVATTLESFGLQPSFYYWAPDDAHQLLGPLDGSLACFAGLVVGLLVVYYKLPR
jgi:hypothetical protein